MPELGASLDLGPYPDHALHAAALELDSADPLAGFRNRFAIPDPSLIYLDGNSLGRLPIEARSQIADLVDHQWGDRLIRSWNEGWWELQLKLGDLLAPLVGARPGEVILSDSTSVNLYKLAYGAVKANPRRHKIVTDDLNFPTDVYVLNAVAGLFTDLSVEVVQSDGIHGPLEALDVAVDEDTALLALSHTAFKSGYTYDMSSVTKIAHEAGAFMLWDCSHSVGVVPISLEQAKVDLAVGCTYKYLNGGPGSPAFLFVRSDLQDSLENPIEAWWAHDDPFAFDLEFRPTHGIRRFHTGTMPTLSLAAVEAGIRHVAEAGLDAIRSKSISLSELFVELWRSELQPLGFELRSPSETAERGSHISLGHEDAWPIARAMIENANVIPDFRAPDNLRMGLAPLYTSFVDVHTAVIRIRDLVRTRMHHEFAGERLDVT